MTKTYVLDTNVLLHDAQSLTAFPDGEVVITLDVLEELDEFKTARNDLGRTAREVVRRLDVLRQVGDLSSGIGLPTGGRLTVRMDGYLQALPITMDPTIPDNRILACALALKAEGGRDVVFVSKDLNARVKSDALRLTTVDYEPTKVHFDELYTGFREVEVESGVIDHFYKERKIPALEGMYPNEFALLKSAANPKHTGLARHDAAAHALVPLRFGESNPWKVRPLNVQQHFAIELLMDSSVQLVSLLGKAGTGKTLLALAAGLDQVAERQIYHRILVSRPIFPLGRDIGYLPGTKDEKLESWMEPIFDNLKFLVDPSLESVDDKVGYLFEKGWIEVEAVTYIRGRSLPKLFIIIDEGQNLTPHEIKTIVSRAGRDSKVVLTGDPYQIDNPYLDASSNGLSTLVDRFKEQPIFGHVTLERSERSELASLAAELL
jgi:PhoH-like ATPase